MIDTACQHGSKYAGESPDSVDVLLALLAVEPLDRERFGRFAVNGPAGSGMVRFFGNFANVSHVFSIESTDPEVCRKLIRAIKANPRSRVEGPRDPQAAP